MNGSRVDSVTLLEISEVLRGEGPEARPEVVVDGSTGHLVDGVPTDLSTPEDVATFESAFAAAINDLTRNMERAKAFGTAGRQRCIDEFSWPRIAAQTVEVYQTAIKRHG